MERRISATELARSLGDILGRIRYQGEGGGTQANVVRPDWRSSESSTVQCAIAAGRLEDQDS